MVSFGFPFFQLTLPTPPLPPPSQSKALVLQAAASDRSAAAATDTARRAAAEAVRLEEQTRALQERLDRAATRALWLQFRCFLVC